MLSSPRVLALMVLFAGLLPTLGCSGGMQSLGLAPPQHRFTEQTKMVVGSQYAPAALPKELNKSLLPAYVVEPGDTLLVIPVDLDSPVRLPGDQVVMQDGTIDLGRYGRPVVAGRTVEIIEQELNAIITAKEKELRARPDAEKTELPLTGSIEVSVRIVGRVSKVYYVLGEVNAPGAYPISGRETVLDGIVAAGGITTRASTKKILLSRPTPPEGCRIALPICYDNIVQLGDTSTNYQLMPGDRIFVGSAGLMDMLHSKKAECGICLGPQYPCELGVAPSCANGSCGVAPTIVSPTVPGPMTPAPVAPNPTAMPTSLPADLPPPTAVIPPAVKANPQPTTVIPVSLPEPTLRPASGSTISPPITPPSVMPNPAPSVGQPTAAIVIPTVLPVMK